MAVQSPDQATTGVHDNFEIAPGYRVDDWKHLAFENPSEVTEDWRRAIAIFAARIRNRFLVPAQHLIDSEDGAARGTYGFAVLTLDFLVIECIQGFREGRLSHKRRSAALSISFLTGWDAFTACLPEGLEASVAASNFYEQGRCALQHTGSTDRLLVRKSGRMLTFHAAEHIEVNRSLFHQSLTGEFDAYLGQLELPANADLRLHFRNKMTHICGARIQAPRRTLE